MGLTVLVTEGVKVPVGNHIGKTVLLCSDESGSKLREYIKVHLMKGFDVSVYDMGAGSDGRINCFVRAAIQVGKDESFGTVGIGICSSGIWAAYATKVPGVYAARCIDKVDAVIARKEANSNFLAMGAENLSGDGANRVVDAWLSAEFSKEAENGAYFRNFVEMVKYEQELFSR